MSQLVHLWIANLDTIIADEKPQNNKVFEQDGVKSKMILLNYLMDAEDL